MSRAYEGPDGRQPVLDRLDLTVAPGEFLAVLGPSGCGKTTLLRLLGGFDKPDGGSVTLGGEEVSPSRKVLMIFQESGQLLPWRTLEGNLLFALRRARPDLPKEGARRLAGECLARTGLWGSAKNIPPSCRGG